MEHDVNNSDAYVPNQEQLMEKAVAIFETVKPVLSHPAAPILGALLGLTVTGISIYKMGKSARKEQV